MNDYRLQLMNGIDIPIPELQVAVHSPTVDDIAHMGEQDYFTAMQYLCLEKEMLIQDEILLSSLTNFQVLMKVLDQSEDKNKKTMIVTLLKLLFPDYNATFIKDRSIVLTTDGGNPILIDDSNFDFFQSVVKEVLCVSNLFQKDNIVYNPQSDRAKEIARKIMAGRRKVAEIKSSEHGNESILTRYQSILSVAKIATLKESSSYNLFQLFDLMERYTKYIESDVDLRARLAGATPDKPVESWMGELHPLNK